MQTPLRHLLTLLSLSLALAACPSDKEDTASPEADTDTDTDADTDTDTDTDADTDLPDLTAGLDEGGCEELPDHGAIPGARSYFVGSYLWTEEDTAEGSEQWLIFANDAWADVGGSDCSVVLLTSASKGDAVACGACDFSLAVQATLDAVATDCPEEIYAGDESWEVTYDVELAADGSATWYYASSGNPVGTGYWNASGQNFLTEGTCLWF